MGARQPGQGFSGQPGAIEGDRRRNSCVCRCSVGVVRDQLARSCRFDPNQNLTSSVPRIFHFVTTVAAEIIDDETTDTTGSLI